MTPSLRLHASLLLALGLLGCSGTKTTGEPYESTECVEIPADGVCLPTADVEEQLLGDSCGYTVQSVDGPGEPGTPAWLGDSQVGEDEYCCYPVTTQTIDDGCVIGRPMRVEGSLRTAPPTPRRDWSAMLTPDLSGLSDAERETLSGAWLRTAAGEHASIAAFSRLALELMRLGTPAAMVADVHQAALDEVRHASQAYALASAYLGRAVGPGPLPLPETLSLASNAAEVALSAAREGCRDETLAAALAAEIAEASTDPTVKAVMTQVAADEARHVALSWRVLRWALEQAPDAVAEVEQILLESSVSAMPPEADEAVLRGHGVWGVVETRAAHERGLRNVVRPTWRVLRESLEGGIAQA